jgi:catechol 2,3-dioxygenase-like lactoylglutathione lyase family enzyme
MLRVKDPKKSIAVYTETLGMDLISELAQSGFTLYCLSFCDPSLNAGERHLALLA